jgi:hypothetical protein
MGKGKHITVFCVKNLTKIEAYKGKFATSETEIIKNKESVTEVLSKKNLKCLRKKNL